MLDRRGSGRTGRWQLRAAVVLALTAVAWLVGAGSASAHAALASTDPPADTVLSSVPTHVRLTFTEPVQVATGGVRVFDPDGRQVDNGQVIHPDGDGPVVQVGLRPVTALGSYTVSWRVISTDSHPVAGAFTFSVGHLSATAPPDGVAPSDGDPTVSALYVVVRVLAFGAFAVLVGAVAFALICGPGWLHQTAVRRLAFGGWGGLLAATLAALLLQGPYGYGLGLGAALSPGMIASTLDLRIGAALAARVLLLGVIVVYLGELVARLPSARCRARMVFAAVGVVLAASLATTWAAAGHAASGIQPAIAVPVDVLHLLAMAVWLGGLAVLTVQLWPRPAADAAPGGELAAAVGRFSRIAFGCVVVLIGTGTYQSWHQLGSWSAFVTTDYGRLLLVKLVLVAVIIGAATFSRRTAGRLRAPLSDAPLPDAATIAAVVEPGGRPVQILPPQTQLSTTPTRAVLRRSVLVETVVAAVVLAVTAVLVNTEPSRTGLADVAGPLRTTVSFDTGGPSGAGTMEVLVDPARTGPNDVRVMVRDPSGAALDVAELNVALTMRERNLGPLRLAIGRDGTGSYRASGQLPVAGTWQLTLTVRTSEIDQTTVRVPVEVHTPADCGATSAADRAR
ncbi:MAG: copper resistance CopC/CopD family protein [Pseudonocardiales bacterium]